MPKPGSSGLHPLHRLLCAGAGSCVLLGASGCQIVDQSGSNVAQVRVIQASQNAPGIDFYANGQALAYNVGFAYGSSYVPVAPGAFSITADQAGSRTVLATASQTLAVGQQYSAILSGSASTLQEILLLDQSLPAPSGQIALRVLDEATHAGAVDVYLVPAGGKLTTTGLLMPLASLSLGSNTGYVGIGAGAFSLVVVPAGTLASATTATLLSGPQLTYPSGAVRTVVLLDATGSGGTPAVAAYVALDADAAGG